MFSMIHYISTLKLEKHKIDNCPALRERCDLKGYSSDQSHFSEINVKLAEKNKYATHSVQRSLEMCENKKKPGVSEDFRQKKVLPVTWKSSTSDAIFRKYFASGLSFWLERW